MISARETPITAQNGVKKIQDGGGSERRAADVSYQLADYDLVAVGSQQFSVVAAHDLQAAAGGTVLL